MKSKKISLSHLKVKSFVTSLSAAETVGLMGASGDCPTTDGPCNTQTLLIESVHVDCAVTRVDRHCLFELQVTRVC